MIMVFKIVRPTGVMDSMVSYKFIGLHYMTRGNANLHRNMCTITLQSFHFLIELFLYLVQFA